MGYNSGNFRPIRMTYLTIALPESAKAYVDRQISDGTYNSVDEFLTVLIEQEQERQAKQKANAMLRSTIQKNRKVEATDEWWDQQRKILSDSLPPQV
jgi:Arc/MetJ-type ribon-helix-helix transcriptional regulator